MALYLKKLLIIYNYISALISKNVETFYKKGIYCIKCFNFYCKKSLTMLHYRGMI